MRAWVRRTAFGGMVVGGALGTGLAARWGAPLTQTYPTWNIDFNSSAYPIERAACLTIKIGAGAAAQCGDLRVTHELPAVTIYNSRLAPTLVYNSEHAHPYISTPVDIGMASGTTRPDSVEVQIWVGSAPTNKTLRATRRWGGSEWPAGVNATRRVTVTYDAINDTTGVYFYDLRVANIYPGNIRQENPNVAGGSRNVVNRSASPFGAGWWLVGLDEVKKTYTSPGGPQQYLWIGGDGSTRFFMPPSQTLYDRLDSLVWNAGQQTWTRWLPEGRRTVFNSAGQHTKTINRFGRETVFTYNGNGRLSTISLPSPSGLSYALHYSAAGRLDSVVAPALGATRRVARMSNPSGLLLSVRNPGDSAVAFSYHTAPSNVMNRRTDRAGIPTDFTFDSALKVRTSSVDPGFGRALITLTIRAGESRGLPKSGSPSSVDTTQNATHIDGPRTDVPDTTLLYQERYGSVRRIVQANGATTRLQRGYVQGYYGQDEGWVLLRKVEPLGDTLKYSWEMRGNVTQVVDPKGSTIAGPDTTRFVYDQSYDQLLRYVPPEKDSTVFGVNASNGRREWSQDARGTTSRVNFYYDNATYPEEVNRVVEPAVSGQTATTNYAYHATLRNLSQVTTPLGYQTSYTYDAIGRRTKSSGMIDASTGSTRRLEEVVGYSLRDEADSVRTQTLNVSPSMYVTAYNTFDAEGRPLSTLRYGAPNQMVGALATQQRYDNVGRLRAQVAAGGQVDSFMVDPAGNTTHHVTRRGHVLVMSYDTLNRLTRRVVPEVVQADDSGAFPLGQFPPHARPRFPYFHQPLSGGGFQSGIKVFADTQAYTYDLEGNMLTANNRDGRVRRTYSPLGRIVTDSAAIAVYDRVEVPTAFYTYHIFGLAHSYDRNGRRKTRDDPVGLGSGQQVWTYTTFGAPYVMTDRAMATPVHTATFAYDERGRLASRTIGTSNMAEVFIHDADDRVVSRDDASGRYSEAFGYDGRAKALQVTIGSSIANDLNETLNNTYDGLGAVTFAASTRGSGTADTLINDYLGNVYRKLLHYGDTHSALTNDQATMGVMSIMEDTIPGVAPGIPPSDEYQDETILTYDASGGQNHVRTWVWKWNGSWAAKVWQSQRSEWRWQAYGADGKLRVSQRDFYDGAGGKRVAFSEYRYDALGRRILMRTQVDSGCNAGLPACMSPMERYVWDGDQVLYEFRAEVPYSTHGGLLP